MCIGLDLFTEFILEAIHHSGQLGFVVSRFVLMNNVSFGQFIKHADNGLQKFLGFSFISSITQSFYKSTRSLVLIAISQSFRLVRSDSF